MDRSGAVNAVRTTLKRRMETATSSGVRVDATNYHGRHTADSGLGAPRPLQLTSAAPRSTTSWKRTTRRNFASVMNHGRPGHLGRDAVGLAAAHAWGARGDARVWTRSDAGGAGGRGRGGNPRGILRRERSCARRIVRRAKARFPRAGRRVRGIASVPAPTAEEDRTDHAGDRRCRALALCLSD